MDHIVPIVLLCLGARGGGEPLGAAMQRRSVFDVYADDFADEYEPVAVASLPLHRPVPVLRLLAAAPPALARRRARPAQRPRADYRDRYSYVAPSASDSSYSYLFEQDDYAASSAHSHYAELPSPTYSSHASYEQHDTPAPVVLYARPDTSGGYTYRQKPSRPAIPPQDPVIIRVHKYKIVRD